MKLVRPALIDDATLISSNVPETVTAYNPATNYAVGALARDTINHRVFESLQTPNTGKAFTEAAYWLDVGPTNRWAMFDTVNGTQTTGVPEIDVQIRPEGRVDSIALLNIDASYVHVVVTDATDGVVFDEEFNLVQNDGILDIYAYYYEPIVRKTDLIVTGIVPYIAPTIQIAVSNSGEDTLVGTLIAGQARVMGSTQYGGGPGILDYSRKEANAFGDYLLVERGFSRTGSYRLQIPGGLVDEFVRLMSAYRATPILYIMSDEYASTAVFGIYRSFNVEIAYPTTSLCSLELEGLT